MDTRWRASNKFQGFLIVPDLRSCTRLSTLILCNRSIQMTVVHVSKACGPSCLDKVMKMKDHSTKYESVFKLRSNVKGVETDAPKNVYKSRHIEINRLGSGVPNGAARQNTRSSCRIWAPARAVGYCHIWAIGMCRCEGYGFQAVHSRIGYINQSVWV